MINKSKKSKNLSFLDCPNFLLAQLKFGLPLGLSRILHNLLNMENFFISSYFSLAQFTYYSVGCFENPLVNAARTSMFEIVNIEMTDAMKEEDYSKVIELWRSMTRKLFLIVVPFVAYMIFFSREIIVFIFSDKYLQSIPFFMLFNVFLIVGVTNPEPMFRSLRKTQLSLKIKSIGVFLGLSLLFVGAYYGGAMMALLGKIVGVFLMNMIGLTVAAKLLNTSFLRLFQWKELGIVFLISVILAGALRLIFNHIYLNSFFTLAFSFSFYVLFHFIFSCWARLIKDDEIYHLRSVFNRFILRK